MPTQVAAARRAYRKAIEHQPTTVAELRVQINAGCSLARARLRDHAADETQSEISRDVCAKLAELG